MTKRIISLAMFVVMFIASLGGGIYANVQASQQKTLYNEQLHYVDKYQKLYDKANESNNPIIGSQYFKNLYQEKVEDATIKSNLYKKGMKKFFSFAAILIFVALAMLVCSVVTALPIVKMKKPEAEADDDEPKPIMKAKVEPEKIERKSDFDIILEAPKPSIKDEE